MMVWKAAVHHRKLTNLARELSEQAKDELGLPVMKTALALRVAYPEALGMGLTVAELPDQNARTEMKTLIAEIRRLIR